MKNILLIFFITVLFGCGKNNPVVSRQGIDLDFTKTYPGSGGSTYFKAFNVATVLIWKAEGKNFQYNGLSEKNMAYDNISKTSFAADYTYSNVTSTNIELPPGEYFITMITDDVETPKLAYSYTKFSLKAGQFVSLKKDVTNMVSNGYSVWY
jgi:hypothetical protein